MAVSSATSCRSGSHIAPPGLSSLAEPAQASISFRPCVHFPQWSGCSSSGHQSKPLDRELPRGIAASSSRRQRRAGLRIQNSLSERTRPESATSEGRDGSESQQGPWGSPAGAGSSPGAALWRWTPEAEGPLERPAWSGEDPVSRLVNALISFRPLFALMKVGARQVLISTAEKAGIPWRERMAELRATPEIYREKERLENKAIVYPSYYLQEFHAYEKGNLCWEAAFEVESATRAMCRRAIPWAGTAEEAVGVLRGGWLEAIRRHHVAHAGGRPIAAVLDVGCSVGVSTGYLAEAYPDADVTGLDLSPYFLAVAAFREKEAEAQGKARPRPIRWLHALGEDSGLPDASFDLVSMAYVLHECPTDATRALFREAHRLLRPGGTMAITDNSPKSKVIQNLPAPVFTLMKATEPWSDQYYSLDMEAAAREAGFRNVVCVLSDPRHRTLTATA